MSCQRHPGARSWEHRLTEGTKGGMRSGTSGMLRFPRSWEHRRTEGTKGGMR